jgi:hypothetical protein
MPGAGQFPRQMVGHFGWHAALRHPVHHHIHPIHGNTEPGARLSRRPDNDLIRADVRGSREGIVVMVSRCGMR